MFLTFQEGTVLYSLLWLAFSSLTNILYIFFLVWYLIHDIYICPIFNRPYTTCGVYMYVHVYLYSSYFLIKNCMLLHDLNKSSIIRQIFLVFLLLKHATVNILWNLKGKNVGVFYLIWFLVLKFFSNLNN